MKHQPIRTLALYLVPIAAAASTAPAKANQWVTGEVVNFADYSSYDGGLGILVTLTNKIWGESGSTSNGATACTARFRIAVSQQGVTEEMKNRAWAAVLTAFSTGRPVSFFVDTASSAPYCAVQITQLGPVL